MGRTISECAKCLLDDRELGPAFTVSHRAQIRPDPHGSGQTWRGEPPPALPALHGRHTTPNLAQMLPVIVALSGPMTRVGIQASRPAEVVPTRVTFLGPKAFHHRERTRAM